MGVYDLLDALGRERLLPEAALDIVEHARVRRVRLVEDVLEREVRLPQPVTEVLREDPPAVYIVPRGVSECRVCVCKGDRRGGGWEGRYSQA